MITLEQIRQYPNPDLLAFFEASTNTERKIIYDRLKSTSGEDHATRFKIIDKKHKSHYLSLLEIVGALGRADCLKFFRANVQASDTTKNLCENSIKQAYENGQENDQIHALIQYHNALFPYSPYSIISISHPSLCSVFRGGNISVIKHICEIHLDLNNDTFPYDSRYLLNIQLLKASIISDNMDAIDYALNNIGAKQSLIAFSLEYSPERANFSTHLHSSISDSNEIKSLILASLMHKTSQVFEDLKVIMEEVNITTFKDAIFKAILENVAPHNENQSCIKYHFEWLLPLFQPHGPDRQNETQAYIYRLMLRSAYYHNDYNRAREISALLPLELQLNATIQESQIIRLTESLSRIVKTYAMDDQNVHQIKTYLCSPFFAKDRELIEKFTHMLVHPHNNIEILLPLWKNEYAFIQAYFQYLSTYKREQYEQIFCKALAHPDEIWFHRLQAVQNESFLDHSPSIEFIEVSIREGYLENNVLTAIQLLVSISNTNSSHQSDKQRILEAFANRLIRNIPNDPAIITLASSIPELFEHISSAHDACEWYKRPIIQQQLQIFFKQNEPLNKNQVRLSLECLRYLLRENKPFEQENIINLLLLPALRRALTEQANSLLPEDVLLRVDNPPKALQCQLRLGIPSLSERIKALNPTLEAATNEFGLKYEAKLDGSFLGEEAMAPLNSTEKKVLDTVVERYKTNTSNINSLNFQTHHAYNECLTALNMRYEKNPAIYYTHTGRRISLPLKYEDFEQLRRSVPLNPQEVEAALKEYYRHHEHTAIRFLLIPNRFNQYGWERSAPFESHIKGIFSFWYAVNETSDELRITPTEYSKDQSIDFFITCLGDVGRAHNRDYGRDNHQQDCSSCGPGMLRRFIQMASLKTKTPIPKGEKPLCTSEHIAEATRLFIYQYYADRLTNYTDIKIIQDAISDTETEDSQQILRRYNIEQAAIRAFMRELVNHYNPLSVPVDELFNNLNPTQPHLLAYAETVAPLTATRLLRAIKKATATVASSEAQKILEKNQTMIVHGDPAEGQKAVQDCSTALQELYENAPDIRGFRKTVIKYTPSVVLRTFGISSDSKQARDIRAAKEQFDQTFLSENKGTEASSIAERKQL